MQKETQQGFKLIKVRTETYGSLTKLISKIEKRQPYLNGLVGYNTVIQMLLLKSTTYSEMKLKL